MIQYGTKNPYPDRELCIHTALVNSATVLPIPLQEPIYEPISPEQEPMGDTGDGIPNLINIPEEVFFQTMHHHLGLIYT